MVRLKGAKRLVVCSLHLPTGVPVAQYYAAVQACRSMLRGWHEDLPCVVGVDANAELVWTAAEPREHGGGPGLQSGGKVDKLLELASGCHLRLAPPRMSDRWIPTHYPRDTSRDGRHIDCLVVYSLGVLLQILGVPMLPYVDVTFLMYLQMPMVLLYVIVALYLYLTLVLRVLFRPILVGLPLLPLVVVLVWSPLGRCWMLTSMLMIYLPLSAMRVMFLFRMVVRLGPSLMPSTSRVVDPECDVRFAVFGDVCEGVSFL